MTNRWFLACLALCALTPTLAAAKGKKAAAAEPAVEPAAEPAAPAEPARRATTVAMLEATGSLPSANMVMGQLLGTFRQTMPQVPAEFWDKVEARVDIRDLIGEIAAIYEAHFSEAEVQALLDFYKSPLGLKLAEHQPAISAEGMAAGQAWGERIAAEVVGELQAGGFMEQ